MTTGYQVSFHDFRRLLTDSDWSVPVVPLVREWFGEKNGSGGNL